MVASDPLNQKLVERGRPLRRAEIAEYLAARQGPIRHGTADVSLEIAAQLRDSLAIIENGAARPGFDEIVDAVEWTLAHQATEQFRGRIDKSLLRDRLNKIPRS